ncbi:hypothetical protein OROMI_016252 [Orobanche minor]
MIRLQNFSSLSPEKRNRDTPAYVVLASTVLEMTEHDEKEGVVFEIAIVVSKWGQRSKVDGIDVSGDCIQVLVDELSRKGLNVERVVGLQNEFIKLAASTEVLGKAAAELKFRKRTFIGMDFPFEWDEAEAFIRLPDGSLFSWCERFRCYNHLIYGIVKDVRLVVEPWSRYPEDLTFRQCGV